MFAILLDWKSQVVAPGVINIGTRPCSPWSTAIEWIDSMPIMALK